MKKILLSLSLLISFTAANAQWTEQATNFSTQYRGLAEIKIVDANTVWALAFDGSGNAANVQEFTLTTNGGSSWTAGYIEVGNPDLQITNISPVSATTAWAGTVDSTNGLGGVFKTTNGGATWIAQNTSAYTTDTESWFNAVHFFDANTGITIGDPTGSGSSRKFEVYKTTDGGTTWTALASTMPVSISGEYGYGSGYAASGNSFWFTTSKGRLYKTTDRGVTWTVSQSPTADFGGYTVPGTSATIHFSDANNGCLLKSVGTTTPVYTFYTTVNGGTSWTAGTTFTGTRYILNYIPGTTTIVATSASTTGSGTSVSTNNGATWTDVESADQRGASAFLDATTGWCGGFSTDEVTGGVFKLTGTLGNSHFATAAKFKVYPNPATSTVTISAADVDSYELSVVDLSGKIIMTKSLNGIENTLDVSALSTGAYFFNLSSDNKREVVKFLKN